jgi:hypothetical protein
MLHMKSVMTDLKTLQHWITGKAVQANAAPIDHLRIFATRVACVGSHHVAALVFHFRNGPSNRCHPGKTMVIVQSKGALVNINTSRCAGGVPFISVLTNACLTPTVHARARSACIALLGTRNALASTVGIDRIPRLTLAAITDDFFVWSTRSTQVATTSVQTRVATRITKQSTKVLTPSPVAFAFIDVGATDHGVTLVAIQASATPIHIYPFCECARDTVFDTIAMATEVSYDKPRLALTDIVHNVFVDSTCHALESTGRILALLVEHCTRIGVGTFVNIRATYDGVSFEAGLALALIFDDNGIGAARNARKRPHRVAAYLTRGTDRLVGGTLIEIGATL